MQLSCKYAKEFITFLYYTDYLSNLIDKPCPKNNWESFLLSQYFNFAVTLVSYNCLESPQTTFIHLFSYNMAVTISLKVLPGN